MRTKKTIRTLSPLARRAAKLSRELNSVRVRLDNLTDWIEDNEVERRVAVREVTELRARDLWGAACRSCDQKNAGCNAPCRFGRQVPDLFPETGPGGGDPPAQVQGPDPRD